jgi:predicted RNA binding protein YcfA (HicA-like mRNA interferase family)
MKSISGTELCIILERKGWSILRIKGSHHIYGKTGSVIRLSVPVHGTKSLGKGLLSFLMKMANLTEDDIQ